MDQPLALPSPAPAVRRSGFARFTLRLFATAVLAALASAATLPVGSTLAGPITIGPGPALGTDRAGVTWYQEFQDRTAADCKALDEAGAGDQTHLYHDGYDDSRDLVAFYKREEGGNVYFRVGLVPRDDAGVALKPGLYFVRVKAGVRDHAQVGGGTVGVLDRGAPRR